MLITSTYIYLISPLKFSFKFSFRTFGLEELGGAITKDNKEYQTSYKNVLQQILAINQMELKAVIFLIGGKDLVEDFLKEGEVVPKLGDINFGGRQ